MNQKGSNEFSFYGVELDCNHKTLTLGKITSWIPSTSDEMHGGPIYHTKIAAHDGNYDDYTTSGNSNSLSHCIGERLDYKSYSFNNGVWYKVKIEANGNNIKIYINGAEIINYTDNNSPILSGGYGPYTASDPNGHFKNVKIETQNVKKLIEALREPDWRENSIKVLVNVSDVSNKELNSTNQMGELLTRLIDESIHFVGWGNDKNKAEFENLIATNNGMGKFINNTALNTSITETAKYIKSLIAEIETDNVYVLAENQLEFVSNPSDVFTNAKDEHYPYGKWKIVHDYNFYDNNLGQYEKSGMYIPNMEKSFRKTGKYTISFEDLPTNPEIIYIHRRPIAIMKLTKVGNSITTISESYDLDKYNDPDKGISQIEWKYKKTSEQAWKNGQLKNITDDSDYIVQLRVKDYQNVWSRPVSMYATNNIDSKPIASFRIKNNEITKYENLEIIDSSYDPYGGTIVERKWEVFKDGIEGAIQSTINTLPKLNYTELGTYKMKLTVKNNRGTYSEVFSRRFTITEDSIPPSFAADPESCDWKYSVDVKLNFTDEGGSNFKNYQYAITESQETPTTYPFTSNRANDTVTINEDGIKYLHIIATDNAGNTSLDRVLGPYNIDSTPPTGSIDYNPKSWVIDYADLTYSFDDDKSGVDRVVLPNGQVTTNKTGTYRVTDNDVYNFTVYDKIGNSVVISKQITNIDHIKPAIGLTQKNTEWSAETTNISWECADNESGFREILLPNGMKSNNLTGEFIVRELGTYTFIAYDNVGNEHKAEIQVQNIDKIPPTLELSQNITQWVNDNVLINWSATDNESGLKQVLLPDGKIVTDPTGAFTAKANGKYSFVAYDNLLNSVIKTIEIKNIDKIAPTIEIDFIQENIIDGKIKIRYTAEDNESGIKEVLLPNGNKSTEQTGTYDITANGTYTFIAFDEAGNMKKGTIKIISFK